MLKLKNNIYIKQTFVHKKIRDYKEYVYSENENLLIFHS